MADRDRDTRDRLLDAAETLFSTRGFARVTVRDISQQAHANVAAVNYHFGGKQGLYEAVLRKAIAIMQASTAEMRAAGAGRPPDEQLEAVIRIWLTRVTQTQHRWIHQLMMQEVSSPTPSFQLVVKQVLEPRMAYVRGIISAMLQRDVSDERTGLCLMTVWSQLLALLRPMDPRMDPRRMPAAQLDALASHVARFSIAGIAAIAATGRRLASPPRAQTKAATRASKA